MRAAGSGCPVILINTGKVVKLGLVGPIQADLNGFNLSDHIPVRDHNTRSSDIQFPTASLVVTIETWNTFQFTSALQKLRNYAPRPHRRCGSIPKLVNCIARESPHKQGLSVHRPKGEQREEISVSIIADIGWSQLSFRCYNPLISGRVIKLSSSDVLSGLKNAAQLLIGCCHADVRGCGIQVKHTPAFATSVAAKHILIQFDIQVCFSVSAKWASAMELRSSVTNHLDTEQIHYIPNAASRSTSTVSVSGRW